MSLAILKIFLHKKDVSTTSKTTTRHRTSTSGTVTHVFQRGHGAYADAVLDFMTRSMTYGTTTAVCGYIDRVFVNKSSPGYTKYVNLYEREAEKVNAGIYELTLPRDVFWRTLPPTCPGYSSYVSIWRDRK